MSVTPISSIETLREYLHAAIRLEHATLPVYLTALCSLRPGQKLEAAHALRSVVMKKVLHVTLAANILNAVGGKVDLNQPGFVPSFPVLLPDGEADLQVDLQMFSREALDTFLKIERSAKAASESGRFVKRAKRSGRLLPTVMSTSGEELHFFSIREFYDAIEVGMERLCASLGENKVFTGDRANQVTPEYYYSGAAAPVPVYDLASAKVALRMIVNPDEGLAGSTAHFAAVDWEAVYPVMKNARLSDYPENSEVARAARDYQSAYSSFLNELSAAYAGNPDRLIPAVGGLFRLKDLASQLASCPIPGGNELNAAPLFSK